MAGKQYQLRWNTHNSTFVNLLDQFRAQELYCDASLACCGRVYPVHQVVLSACSEFFSYVFTQASASQQQPVVVVQGAGQAEVESLLEFIYTGRVTVSRGRLPALLRVAASLQVKGLVEASQFEAMVESSHMKRTAVNEVAKDGLVKEHIEIEQMEMMAKTNNVSGLAKNTWPERQAASRRSTTHDTPLHNTPFHRTQAFDTWSMVSQPLYSQLGDTRPLDTRLGDTLPLDTRLGDTRPLDTRLGDTRPLDTQLGDTPPLDTQLGDTRPLDTRLGDTLLLDTRLSDTRPLNRRLCDTQPVYTRLGETPLLDTRLGETRPLDTQLCDTQPLDPQLSNTQPLDRKVCSTRPASAPSLRSLHPATHHGPFHSLCETKEEPSDLWLKQEEEDDDDDEEDEDEEMEESWWLQQSDMETIPNYPAATTDVTTSTTSPHILPTSAFTPPTSHLRRELLKPIPNLSPPLPSSTPFPPPSSFLPLRTSPQLGSPLPHSSSSPHHLPCPLHLSTSLPFPHRKSPYSSPSPPRSLPHPVITSGGDRAYTRQIPPLVKIPSPGPSDTELPNLHYTHLLDEDSTHLLDEDSTHTHPLLKEPPNQHQIHTHLLVQPTQCPPYPKTPSHLYAPSSIHTPEGNDAPLNLSRGGRGSRDPFLGKIATKRKRRLRGPKCWEYLARLLNDPTTNPTLVRWESRSSGVFRLVQPAIVAQRWGRRAGKHANDALTYENFARGLRYHYATGALLPVSERSFVYKFGPKALKSLQENAPPALILNTDTLSTPQERQSSPAAHSPISLSSPSSLTPVSHSIPTILTSASHSLPTVLTSASHSHTSTLSSASHSLPVT